MVEHLGNEGRDRSTPMPRIIITESAAEGLERCRGFLNEKNPHALIRASQAIKRQFALLEIEPEMGRPIEDIPELRELIIPFGSAGFVTLYRFDAATHSVYVLAFRHQKEAGY